MNENANSAVTWPGWETVRRIGTGSYGAVYEIERDVFGRKEKAALKVISIPQSDSDIEELYDSGYDEASVTAAFQSHLESIVNEYTLMREMKGAANIVNCDDFRIVQHDDKIGWDVYIKMELLTPLTKALDRRPTEEQVMRVAQDMCSALTLCWKHGIIHRDIKPQNIFVSRNGDYKLGDFGIAKTIENTGGGTMIGTYKYMAPEVYNNRPYNLRADIYSLGMVLYWLLNERRQPFMPLPPAPAVITQEVEAREKRFSGAALPPPAHGSEELKRIVLKACAYDPDDRYQTAEEMQEDLFALALGRGMPGKKPAHEEADEDEGGAAAEAVPPFLTADPDEGKTVVNRSPSAETAGKEPEADRPVGPKKKRLWLLIGAVAVVLAIAAGLVLLPRYLKPAENAVAPPEAADQPGEEVPAEETDVAADEQDAEAVAEEEKYISYIDTSPVDVSGIFTLRNTLGGPMTVKGSHIVPGEEEDAYSWMYEQDEAQDLRRIRIPGGGFVLDIDNGDLTDGNEVKVWAETGSRTQSWQFRRAEINEAVAGEASEAETYVIVADETDENGGEYCLAFDPDRESLCIRPLDAADDACVWNLVDAEPRIVFYYVQDYWATNDAFFPQYEIIGNQVLITWPTAADYEQSEISLNRIGDQEEISLDGADGATAIWNDGTVTISFAPEFAQGMYSLSFYCLSNYVDEPSYEDYTYYYVLELCFGCPGVETETDESNTIWAGIDLCADNSGKAIGVEGDMFALGFFGTCSKAPRWKGFTIDGFYVGEDEFGNPIPVGRYDGDEVELEFAYIARKMHRSIIYIKYHDKYLCAYEDGSGVYFSDVKTPDARWHLR